MRLNECQPACWQGERTERASTQRELRAQRKPASRYTLTHIHRQHDSAAQKQVRLRRLVGLFCNVLKPFCACFSASSRSPKLSSWVGCGASFHCVICTYSIVFILFSRARVCVCVVYFFFFRGLLFSVLLAVLSGALTGCGCARP